MNPVWRIPLVLTVVAASATALLWFSDRVTREEIERQEQMAVLASLKVLMPDALHDNDLIAERRSIHEPESLGHRRPEFLYLGTRDGQLTAAVVPVTARNGYSGDIRLLVGIDAATAQVIAVRIASHRETPGLGDLIEPGKSDWIGQFAGRSLLRPEDKGWAVRKDGGAFDQITGATITPRAVVAAVKRALIYFEEHVHE